MILPRPPRLSRKRTTRIRSGTKGRRHEARRHEGTQARRHGGTKARRHGQSLPSRPAGRKPSPLSLPARCIGGRERVAQPGEGLLWPVPSGFASGYAVTSRASVPVSLPFVPPSLRPFVPASLRPFVPSRDCTGKRRIRRISFRDLYRVEFQAGKPFGVGGHVHCGKRMAS